MTSFQDQLERTYASARALAKTAGEDCSVEKAKSPEELIGNAANVDVTENLPAGVEVPGSEHLDKDGDVAEDRGTDVGHVETNGPAPENNEGNEEVQEIISAPEHVSKHASAVEKMADQFLALDASAFSGLGKQASAEPTDADVERYIPKQAAAGNPVMQGIVAYCQNYYAAMQKQASGEDLGEAEALEEGADLEAAAAQAQEEVAKTLMEQAGMGEKTAMEVAGQAVSGVIGDGGESLGGDEAIEAAEALKEQLVEIGMDEAEAEQVALESVAQAIDNGGEAPVEEDVVEEEIPAEEIDKTASAEGGEDKSEDKPEDKSEDKPEDKSEDKPAEEPAAETPAAEEPAAEAAPAEEAPAVDAGSAEVLNTVGDLVEGLAAEIQAQDPNIAPEEAMDAAADQVADALETVEAQQAIGAVDEAGAPVMSDEDAGAAVEAMEKSASAYPLRGVLATAINTRLGLSPEAFAARLNIQ